MTKPALLTLRLLSDTTFAAGGGTAGEVDIEVDHDDLGLPRIRGKRIRSLLRDTWLSMAHCFDLDAAAERIFGPPGDVEELSILRFSTAELEEGVREHVQYAVKRKAHPVEPLEILRTLTSIRAQTSEERESGAPERGSLRSIRVARRELLFYSPLDWMAEPSVDDKTCLALSVLGTRHAGLGRNRGRGFIEILLHESQHDESQHDPPEDAAKAIENGRKLTRALAGVEAR
jgi:hypothetical protein